MEEEFEYRTGLNQINKIPHEAEWVDDKDSALQLPHALLLHSHLTAVHIQGLPVQLRQEQGSPSTGGRGVSLDRTF